jgi:TRAP-type C4-dicarboxylate transport system permease small subunit
MINRLIQLELVICAVLLSAITGLVFIAAIMRFVGHPLTWSVDFAQLLFVWLCFFGANKAMREKSHLGMEVVVKYLNYKPHLWLQIFCSMIVIAFLLLLAKEGYALTLMNKERTFGDSTISYAWVTAAVPAGCLLLSLTLLQNILTAWRRRHEGMLVYTRTSLDREIAAPLEL